MGMKLDHDKLYPWLAILRAKHMGSDRARKLETHFGSIERALHATVDEITEVEGFSKMIAQSIREAARGKFDDEVGKELKWAEKEGVNILVYSDEEYPEPLRHIPAYPAILYVKGTLLPRDVLSFAIVGSRSASDVGKRQANRVANELAEAGLTINSGLAWGVDSAAHKGALRSKKGRTLAVMGNGLKIVYPREHTLLADQIINRGALISELFYDVAPQKKNFPPRNRIISGLSLGVLIIEAPARSGALITARYALEQGKEIYALPGTIEDEHASGCNALIRDSSAKLFTSTEEILTDLNDKIAYYQSLLQGQIPKIQLPNQESQESTNEANSSTNEANSIKVPKTEPKPHYQPASEDERTVLNCLSNNEAKHIDVVCRETGWPTARVSSVLGMLELKGVIERLSGMRFRLAD